MERVVRESFAGCVFEVEDIVYSIFQELAAEDKDRCVCDSHTNSPTRSSRATAISDVHLVLYRFILHVLNHQHVLMASSQDRGQLRSGFLSFLIGRISQLSGEQGQRSATDQTPLPYTLAFLACLAGKQNSIDGIGLRRDFLCSAEQQYLAADLCRHISIISFMSTCADEQRAAPIQPAPTVRKGISFGSQPAPRRSISPASTSSSSYDGSDSPISPISSVSSAPGGSPVQSLFSKPPTHQPVLSPTGPSQETLQMTRLLRHERHCLDLCFEELVEAGIDHSTMDVMKLFADFHALAEHIYRDPNIGSTYQPFDAHDDTNLTCTLKPPAVPSKRRRGSVAAARAGLTAESPVTRQLYRQEIGTQRSLEGLEWTKAVTQTEQTIVAVPLERDRSRNKLPVVTKTRTARASSEVSRIESIMNEIDGVSLRFESKASSRIQRRTASESVAVSTQSEPKLDARGRFACETSPDAEAMKLSKARLETQRHLDHDTHRRKAKGSINKGVKETAIQRSLNSNLPSKTTEEINESNIERRVTCPPESAGWVRAPPLESSESVEARARKLHRASRLGGPKWKAPF